MQAFSLPPGAVFSHIPRSDSVNEIFSPLLLLILTCDKKVHRTQHIEAPCAIRNSADGSLQTLLR